MALSPPTIAASIMAAAPDMAGLLGPSTAVGIANGVYQWIIVPANYALTGITTGVVGAGQVLGKLTVSPNIPAVSAALASVGVAGITSATLARGVAVGIATAVSSSGQYQGQSVGVAIGTDTSFVTVSNGATLATSLSTALATSYGGSGLALPLVSQGLGIGIATMLQTATGIGIVAGTPTGSVTAVGTSPLSTVF